MNDDLRPKVRASDDTKTEPKFRPPESMLDEGPKTDKQASSDTKPKNKKSKRNPVTWFNDLTKKQKGLVIAAIVVVLIAIIGGVWALVSNNKPAPEPTVTKEEPKEEPAAPIYSPLTGVKVTKEQSELPVIGVMIENSPDARPQSGLHKAGVVFEAIAEGGITRFLTLYQEDQPDYIGPIRSVRPYYVDWLQGFDASIAHVGGSAEALQKIRNEGVKDLDQFSNPGPYNRVRNRYAPHNMYSSLPQLLDLAKQKGFTTAKFTGFPRKAEAPSKTPTATQIQVRISGRNYDTSYTYDASTNTYKRSLAGNPHTDERSKTQIAPKVVVALVMKYSIHPDGIHSVYNTIGSGTAYIFQDGVVTQATWEKTSSKAQITFVDANKNVVKLNPGQTWLTATSETGKVSYTP